MSTLIFPSSPYSGQVYPEQPIPGVKQYQYNAQADTWELTAGDGPCICLPANNVILDNIAGSFDGINTTFGLTLSDSPYEPPNAAQMIVTVGNIMQEAFVEYTIAGATITFTTAPEAGLDCVLLVLAGGQEAPASNLLLDDIQAGFNGTTSTFLLKYEDEPYTPINEEQLVVNLGGIQQKPGEHYTVALDTITFTTPPAAGINCFIIALYGGGFAAPAGGGGPQTFLIDTDNNIWSCNTAITPDGAFGNFLAGECAGANLTGAYNYNNTFIGSYAGFSHQTGCSNVFVGDSAGDGNQSGSYNIFLGKRAGSQGLSSSRNISIGCEAGFSTTTGCNNNFTGQRTGLSNTTGSYNNFTGFCTGHSNTTGSYNNFTGFWTGRYNTTGEYNNFFGSQAGYRNISGCYNTFVGEKAGQCNTTGNRNSYVGFLAGQQNTGGYNAAIGNGALRYGTGCFNAALGHFAGGVGNRPGCCNIYVGYYSGPIPGGQTGANNTYIGYRAGCATALSSTSANNILIGCLAGGDAVLNLTTQSNQIVLGNNAHTNAFIKIGWTVTSDERDKTCVSQISHGREFLQKLEPVQFNWKDRESGEVTDEKPRYGFLAQQVLDAEGEPSILVDDSDSEHLKLRESMMIPVLFKIIQEMDEELRSLRAEVDALRG